MKNRNSPRFIAFCEIMRTRSKTLCIPDNLMFFFKDDKELIDGMYEDEFMSVMEEGCAGGYAVLSRCEDLIEELEDDGAFGKNVFEYLKKLHGTWATCPVKLNYLIKPLRYAMSGMHKTPSIDDVLFILGKEKALNRVRLCIARYDAS